MPIPGAQTNPTRPFLAERFSLRDWLLARDPAYSRMRMGGRVTLSIVLAVAILILIHRLVLPLPAAAYGIAATLAIQSGLTVRDPSAAAQLTTRLIGCAGAVAMIGLAALLEPWRSVSDIAFLAVIFMAAYARRFGTRWAAVGMFCFMSYFIGAYLHPPLAQLPEVAVGALVAALSAHVVRTWVLPDDWQRDFLRAMVSVLGRVDHIVEALRAIAVRGMWTAEDRQALNRLENRLKEAVLMADGLVPVSRREALPEENEPAADIGLALFDLHLAAESLIVLSRQSLPEPELLSAFLASHQVAPPSELEMLGKAVAASAETRRALNWLGEARRAAVDAVERLRAERFTGFNRPQAAAPAPKPAKGRWLNDPALRTALQITLAAGLAMIGGLALSRDRWFWAVLSAFLVFTNTNSRGDTAIKAMQRSGGTLIGIVCGMGLSALLSGFPWLAGAVAILAVFLAFFSLQASYTAMTFFISIVICIVYGLTGTLTLDLLRLRLEETVIGAVTGMAVAFFVLPTRTQTTLGDALAKWFDAAQRLLEAAAEEKSGAELITLSKALDAAYRDVTQAARPLGVSWQLVTRPGHIRQTLAIMMAATYWSRIFARRVAFARAAEMDAIRPAIRDALTGLERVRAKGTGIFFVNRKPPQLQSRHLPIAHDGSRLGIEMIAATLDRLYP